MKSEISYSKAQLVILVSSRVLIGWYCLYEGMIKWINPSWSAFAFLNDSQGWLAPFFHSFAANPTSLSVVNFLNIYGLIAIGLGLILGLFTRMATVSGIVLIFLYFLSHPALINTSYMLPSGESAMWVNKNLIFVFLLLILLVYPTGDRIGLDRLLFNRFKN
ncbi:DoxX family membrane protein [Mangrovibacterium lignilyticum]|uniref:DoxX family membrane protein n=1 Tax=Mangrovibacterium lignilyticum TaxID=2668052 RepID=UPI0013D207FC|nr:DoxX family membrane protein [Mangrovibacterium lignilyticum]